MDPFSKLVEIRTVPSLHSWRVAEFLYDDLVAHWGKPHYVWTNNGTEFVGTFEDTKTFACAKVLVSSITTSPLVIVRPTGRLNR